MELGFTPVHYCEGPGADIINERMTAFERIDVSSGKETDRIILTVDVTGLKGIPKEGGVLTWYEGYEESGVVKIGKFKITTITPQLFPRVITITATAAPFEKEDKTGFRQRRSASWDNTTLGEIFQAIAQRHGLSPRMDARLSAFTYQHVDQTGETDSAFLNRLAEEHDAVAKPVNGAYILALRGEAKSITGKTLPVVKLTCPPENAPGNQLFIQCSVDTPGKKGVKGVKVQYTDEATGEVRTLTSGDAPYRTIPGSYVNKEHAEAALKGGHRKSKRQSSKIHLDTPGNPYVAAEGLVELDSTFPDGMRGQVSIDRVVVRCSRNEGYRMSITASKPLAKQ
jgi:phage protein D